MTAEADPFGALPTTERVLAEWAAAPQRFREDANAEEDLAFGGYRDRVVVELAQNAADAAVRAGVPGRLLLRLTGQDGEAHDTQSPAGVLVAANTGAPLDAEGVSALATLRASAKRPGEDPGVRSVGRFGVGFAAVLAVTDTPTVLSRSGGVRFSRADTHALVAELAADRPGLAAELERREGHVPVLRLPLPAEGEPPVGYDTAVLLPLRDGSARDLLTRLLDEVDDALLLALPGLDEVVIEVAGRPPRRLADVTERWHRVQRTGTHDPRLLADRPTEERQRPAWSVTWAVPVATGRHGVASVVHAPTPTDEPLDWPAVLVATFPLEPSRRHVAPGPATQALVGHAAEAYAELLVQRTADGADVLPLVPTGLPGGRLDADLREALLPLLPTAAVLRGVEDGRPVRPRDAVALEPGPWADDPGVLAALAPFVAGLVAAPRPAEAALTALGVHRLALVDLVEQLPEPSDDEGWLALYRGLSPLGAESSGREALSTLPVPLRDGRTVRGARGAVLVGPRLPEASVDLLVELGLRVVAPQVAADAQATRLLERLGAASARPLDLLTAPELRNALSDPAHPDLADAVLPLVAAAVSDGDLPPAGLPWLSDLLLPDHDGDLVPADVLVQPGSTASRLLDDGSVGQLADDVFARWPAAVWNAVGVTDCLHVRTFAEVDTLDLPDELDELDGAQEWAAQAGPGTATELRAVPHLELVDADRWPQALQLLATEPALRRAVLEPVLLTTLDGDHRRVDGHPLWWLRRELDLAGRAAPDASTPLQSLLPPAPAWAAGLDPALAAVLGLVRDWVDLDAAAWQRVLDRLAVADDPPELPALLRLWAALATAAPQLSPPDRLWALTTSSTLRGDHGIPVQLVAADDAVVPDAPMWLQRTDLGAALVVPPHLAERLADVLDLDLASERADGDVDGEGHVAVVPPVVRALLPGAPERWHEHDRLTIDGVDVDWWVGAGGDAGQEPVVHACTLDGLARGMAQACGRWDLRLVLEQLLTDPGAQADVLVDQALTGPSPGAEPAGPLSSG